MSRIDTHEVNPSSGAPGAPTGIDADYQGALAGLGLLGARVYLLILPTIMLDALFGADMPANVLFLAPAIGFLLVTPRRLLLKLPISPALIIFCGWIAISVLWSIDRTRTLFLVREDLVPVFGAMIVIGLLPVEESLKWLVRGVKLMVVITVVVLLTLPETREWVRLGDDTETAWAAWFGSKNQLGRSALVAFMTLLFLDKTAVSRWVFMVATTVLILGSSSATALAGAMFAVGIWIWGIQFRRTRREWSGTFIFTSIILGIFVIVIAFISAAWFVGLLGRDLSFSGRTDVWIPSLDFIEAKPWFGYGYRALFGSNTQETLDLWRDLGFYAAHGHNGPIETALGLGLVGLMLFFVVYLETFAASLRYLKEHDVALFTFCFLLVMMPVAIVEPVFQDDWFSVLVVCRVLLLRVRVDSRGAHDPSVR